MKRVITYGTFDLFHQGHYNILKRAKEYGDYLIVGVTGESYDIERGKLNVQDSLLTRIRNVEETGFADEIIIEEYQGQKISDVQRYNIDTLIVGSDWRGKFDYLNEYCEVVYLERTKDISSTQIRERKGVLSIGIATDNPDDKNLIEEALYVSGIHTKSAYSADVSVLEEMKGKFELDSFSTDYDDFLHGVDIVYVKTAPDQREDLVLSAIQSGKHVIVEPPLSTDIEVAKELFRQAKKRRVAVVERQNLAFLRAFTQLIWFLHGGAIGDIVTARLVCGSNQIADEDLTSLQYSSLYAALKIANETTACNGLKATASSKESLFNGIYLPYPDKLISIELSTKVDLDNGLTIFGTDGFVHVPDDWWNMGYFEVFTPGQAHPKRYSFNFEGNGFRYLLRELLIALKLGKSEIAKYPFEETLNLINAFGKIREIGNE